VSIDRGFTATTGRSILDLEAERVAQEDQLEHARAAYPSSQAIADLEHSLSELTAEIAALGHMGPL